MREETEVPTSHYSGKTAKGQKQSEYLKGEKKKKSAENRRDMGEQVIAIQTRNSRGGYRNVTIGKKVKGGTGK